MTVLVTGGAGYIGSHMVLELLSHGEDVLVIDNLSTGARFVIPDNVKFVQGDIGNADLLSQLFRDHDIEAVIHFAGSIVVPESVKNPLDYYLNNTVNSRLLIEYAIKNQVRNFIFSSTAAVYGIPETNPIKETARLDPISPYGCSKMMTEFMLRDAANAHSFEYVALRYFNVAGADPEGRTGQCTPNATHLIKIASKAALGTIPEMHVYGTDYPTRDGTGIRDYIHVSDLANAHMKALQYLRNGGKSEVFNCGYGSGYSVTEVINAMKDVSGTDFTVKQSERRLGDPAELVADVGKIKKSLSWELRHNDLNLIIRHALNWEQSLSKRS